MENRFKKLRLEYLVEGKPLSQRALAPLIGISGTHISELETGRTASFRELKCYHEFFRVSYEYLLNETDDLVCADIFREKPLNETKMENTIRWLNQSDNKTDIKMGEMVKFLLTTEKGLATLFYLSEYMTDRCSIEELENALSLIKSQEYNETPYAMLRTHIDEKNREHY